MANINLGISGNLAQSRMLFNEFVKHSESEANKIGQHVYLCAVSENDPPNAIARGYVRIHSGDVRATCE